MATRSFALWIVALGAIAVQLVVAPPSCAVYNHFELAPIVSVEGGVYLIGGSSDVQAVGSGLYYFQRIPAEFPLQIREPDVQCTVNLVHCTDPVGEVGDDVHCTGSGIWEIGDDCVGKTLSMFSLGTNMGPDRFLYETSCSYSPPPPSPQPASPPPLPPLPPGCATPMAIVYVVDRSTSLQPVAAQVRSLLHLQLSFLNYETSVACIVAYGLTSYVVSDFTTDEQALHEAVDEEFDDALFNGITHMSAGLETADALFSSFDAEDLLRIIVLVTDGEQNPAFGGTAAAIASAEQTKENGHVIFALAINEPDMDVVNQVASEPSDVHAVNVDSTGTIDATWQLYEFLCPTQTNACDWLDKTWGVLHCGCEGGDRYECARVEDLYAHAPCCPLDAVGWGAEMET